MFEAAELGRTMSKEEFKTLEPVLRVGLLTVQYEIRDADFPVHVVLAGTNRIGCAEVINLLHEWMDARYLEARVFERPSDEERERPRFWRYWRHLARAGHWVIFDRSWYGRCSSSVSRDSPPTRWSSAPPPTARG